MTLVKKEAQFIETPVGKSSKDGIRVISEMGTWRIVGYIVNRHRYGLSLAVNFVVVGYFVWDKVGRWFF